jgi:hypothetical protein
MKKCYSCIRCGYETTHKTNIKNHLKRKKICKPLLNNVNPLDHEDEILLNTDNGKLSCNNCNKAFTRSDNCKRHEIICPKKDERIKELEERINNLTNNPQTINNTTNNNTNTNSHNTTNITNNIVLNNYTDPDMSHIKNGELLKALKDKIDAYANIFELIYFHKNAPQNHSILYPNIRNDRILMFNDGNFKTMSIEDFNNVLDNQVKHDIHDMLGVREDSDKKVERAARKFHESRETRDEDLDNKKMLLRANDLKHIPKNTKKLLEL